MQPSKNSSSLSRLSKSQKIFRTIVSMPTSASFHLSSMHHSLHPTQQTATTVNFQPISQASLKAISVNIFQPFQLSEPPHIRPKTSHNFVSSSTLEAVASNPRKRQRVGSYSSNNLCFKGSSDNSPISRTSAGWTSPKNQRPPLSIPPEFSAMLTFHAISPLPLGKSSKRQPQISCSIINSQNERHNQKQSNSMHVSQTFSSISSSTSISARPSVIESLQNHPTIHLHNFNTVEESAEAATAEHLQKPQQSMNSIEENSDNYFCSTFASKRVTSPLQPHRKFIKLIDYSSNQSLEPKVITERSATVEEDATTRKQKSNNIEESTFITAKEVRQQIPLRTTSLLQEEDRNINVSTDNCLKDKHLPQSPCRVTSPSASYKRNQQFYFRRSSENLPMNIPLHPLSGPGSFFPSKKLLLTNKQATKKLSISQQISSQPLSQKVFQDLSMKQQQRSFQWTQSDHFQSRSPQKIQKHNEERFGKHITSVLKLNRCLSNSNRNKLLSFIARKEYIGVAL